VHDLVAGDMMVDRSIRRERLRPLSLRWIAAHERESRQLRELAGSFFVIGEWWLAEDRCWKVRLDDRLERSGSERAQRVKATAGELPRERQRCSRVRETALI
jgi:hypothetical protein